MFFHTSKSSSLHWLDHCGVLRHLQREEWFQELHSLGTVWICDRFVESGRLVYKWMFYQLDHPEIYLVLYGINGDWSRNGSLHKKVDTWREFKVVNVENLFITEKSGRRMIHISLQKDCLVLVWFPVFWKLSKFCQSIRTLVLSKYRLGEWSWTSWSGLH